MAHAEGATMTSPHDDPSPAVVLGAVVLALVITLLLAAMGA